MFEKRKNGPCTCPVRTVPYGERGFHSHAADCLSLYPLQASPGDAPAPQPKPARLNARQFFDVWARTVGAVGMARGDHPVSSSLVYRPNLVDTVQNRYGHRAAAFAGGYFDQMMVELRSGGVK